MYIDAHVRLHAVHVYTGRCARVSAARAEDVTHGMLMLVDAHA
jgi:hypothetical protein